MLEAGSGKECFNSTTKKGDLQVMTTDDDNDDGLGKVRLLIISAAN